MTEIQFMNKIAEYESYYERTLEPDMIDGYKNRYMKLDYELFTGMLEHIKDNFKPSYSKKYPNYVDFNAAKSIVQTKLNAAKKPEQVKEKYMSHEIYSPKKCLECTKKCKIATLWDDDYIKSIAKWW